MGIQRFMNSILFKFFVGFRSFLILCCMLYGSSISFSEQMISFLKQEHSIEIRIENQKFAKYVFQDPNISRPYFCDIHTQGGIQVTRNHPPIAGVDPDDHATYHPGLWLTFGDINGYDFWRNKAVTKHIRFVKEPESAKETATFSVLNHYLSQDETTFVCQEICHYSIMAHPSGTYILSRSIFSSPEKSFTFGDQEEMGLGVRVATPISVKKGGTILNSNGQKNEDEVWGKQAVWCDYHGEIDGHIAGILLMPSSDNFRKSWFHARDYGLLLANPFGRNAFTKKEKSKVEVPAGQEFTLEFGVFIYSTSVDQPLDRDQIYNSFYR